MSDHSARPRIESVGTFVLTVDEPPPTECLTFDADVGPATYSVVGTASGTGEGPHTLTLDSDALVTTEDDSYVLAVVIGTWTLSPSNSGHTDSSLDISDDSGTAVPSYLKLDGEDCFSGDWITKTLFDGGCDGPTYIACADTDPLLSGRHWTWTALIGYRALTNLLPSGTTITFDTGAVDGSGGAIQWEAQAILVKNLAPYVSSSRASNDSFQLTAYGEGGVIFSTSFGDNHVPDSGSCGIFEGVEASGDAREAAEGTDLMSLPQSTDVQMWHGSDPPCDCSDNTSQVLGKISITIVGSGGGTYTLDTGSLIPGFDFDNVSGRMLPGQGYY